MSFDMRRKTQPGVAMAPIAIANQNLSLEHLVDRYNALEAAAKSMAERCAEAESQVRDLQDEIAALNFKLGRGPRA